MKKLLLFAFFLHFLIAPLTFHPDNKLVLFWAGQEEGKVWNIWEYGEKNFTTVEQFNYPPLHFYLDKFQYGIAKILAGQGYDQWLASSNLQDPYEKNLIRYTVATKFTLILFSLGVGYLIYLIAKQYALSEKQSIFAASLWLFNPIVIYSITMMGQNDVMAILFFLLGWWLLAKSNIAAIIVFGLSASIKTYPLIWLPFLLLPEPKSSIKAKIAIIVSSIVVYIATLLPFISNEVFREAVLHSSINDRFFVPRIDLGYSEVIYIIPLLLILALYGSCKLLGNQKNSPVSLENQAVSIMTASFILLGFSHFHPQWFTWIVPFWSLWLVIQKKAPIWLISLVCILTLGAWSLILLLFPDPYLFQGILSPVNPSFSNIPIIRDLLIAKGFDLSTYNNLAHSWIAGVSLILVIHLFNKKNDNEKYFFSTLNLPRLPFGKKVNFILISVMALLITFGVIFIAHMVPVPRSSAPAQVERYTELTNEISFTIIPLDNQLNRIEIPFRNLNLLSKDDFTFTLLNENQSIILQTPFSGYNIGDPGSVRFEIPPISDSKDRKYTIKITPVTQKATNSANYLLIGLEENDELAYKSYYQSTPTIRETFTKAMETYWHIITQVPWLYLLILIALFFAL